MKRLHAFAAIGVLSLFLVPALSVFAADINIGLHVKDSTGIVNIAGSTDLNASKLHIETATGIKSVLYVAPADPAASKAMIRLGSGATMALKKFIGAPATPTGLATTSALCGGNVNLTWNASANAKNYKVYRNGVLIASPSSPNLIDVTPLTSTSYTYTAVSSNASGDSATSTAVSAVSSQVCAPASFGIQSVGSCGTGQVTLSWVPQNDAQAYKITRTNNVTSTTVVATTTGSTASTYTDSGLTANTSYTYYAVSSNGRGGYATSTPAVTNSPNVCPLTVAPATFTISQNACGTHSVTLTWSAVTGATGYKVEVVTAGIPVVIATTTATTYTYTSAYAISYTFQIVAYNGAGDSSAAATASGSGPINCLAAAPKFWMTQHDWAWYFYPANENTIKLNWTSTNATRCSGYGDGLMYGDSGTWTSASSPASATSKSGLETSSLATGINPSTGFPNVNPLTQSTMFPLYCQNSDGKYGDEVALTVTPAVDGSSPPFAGMSFVPSRTAGGDPVYDTGTGIVTGTLQYGCGVSNSTNLLEVSTNGGSSWSTKASGTSILAMGSGGLGNTVSGAQGGGPKTSWDGTATYRLTCKSGANTAVMYDTPRVNTGFDWIDIGWYPTMISSPINPPAAVANLSFTSMGFPSGDVTAITGTINYSCSSGSGTFSGGGSVPGTYGGASTRFTGSNVFTLTCGSSVKHINPGPSGWNPY